MPLVQEMFVTFKDDEDADGAPRRVPMRIAYRCEHVGHARESELIVGQVYAIAPLRPTSRHQHPKKNAGRQVRVLAFVPFDEDHPHDLVARVRYLDNNRIGRVELMYLVPAPAPTGDAPPA